MLIFLFNCSPKGKSRTTVVDRDSQNDQANSSIPKTATDVAPKPKVNLDEKLLREKGIISNDNELNDINIAIWAAALQEAKNPMLDVKVWHNLKGNTSRLVGTPVVKKYTLTGNIPQLFLYAASRNLVSGVAENKEALSFDKALGLVISLHNLHREKFLKGSISESNKELPANFSVSILNLAQLFNLPEEERSNWTERCIKDQKQKTFKEFKFFKDASIVEDTQIDTDKARTNSGLNPDTKQYATKLADKKSNT